MKLTLRIAGSLLFLFSCSLAIAQPGYNNLQLNPVTSAVPFLRISPDARGGAMGDVGVATTPDANSSFWNGAKLPFIETKGGMSLTYTPWLKDLGVNDVFLATLAGYYKVDDQSAISASVRYFNLGEIQFTDYSGNALSNGKPTEVAVDFGYSRKLSAKWGVGAALRYINSNLTRGYASNSGVVYKAGNTVAGDLSVFYNGVDDAGKGWRFGAALTNLGGKIAYSDNALEKDYIPANLGLGVSYTAVVDEDNRILFDLDINKLMVPTPPLATGDSARDEQALNDYRTKGVVNSWFSSFTDADNEFKEYQFSFGAEYAYKEQFFARAGYFYEDKTKGNRQYFAAGLGLKFNVFGLNFSYIVPSGNGTNRNPLSNTLRFSLLFDFDDVNSQ